MDLRQVIRDVQDFPVKGVLFRDITPILTNPDALSYAIDSISKELKDVAFDVIAGPESRGYLFGLPVAYNMRKSFVQIRKAGKLPCECYRKEYDLEYGTAIIEMHKDAIKKGDKVVVIDDLLATGGTAKAIVDLIEEAGGEVAAMIFLIELKSLRGREKLKGYNVSSVVEYM